MRTTRTEKLGPPKRLGTVAEPAAKPVLEDFSRELRLSHYWSQILLPVIEKENNVSQEESTVSRAVRNEGTLDCVHAGF